MDTFLGRALTDAATGLPNFPYFQIIQNWEERRARRRNTSVRVLRLAVAGGGEGSRRALLWRLCQELRTSDLIASDGRDLFHILLTSPDAENAEAIARRVEEIGQMVSGSHTQERAPLSLTADVQIPPSLPIEKGPCDPCEDHELTQDTAGPFGDGGL